MPTPDELERLLQELLERVKGIETLLAKQTVLTKGFLSTDEACDYLGISKSLLYKFTSENMIPFHRMGGGKKLCFVRSELDEWQAKFRVSTDGELRTLALINMGKQDEQKGKKRKLNGDHSESGAA